MSLQVTLAVLMRDAALTIRMAVEAGPVAATIIAYAERESVDLIVLAMHGRSGVPRWPLESIAEKVLHALLSVLLTDERRYLNNPSHTLPMSGEDSMATPALFDEIYRQNWENVRHIKSERMWLMNTHAIVSAGTLSLLQTISGEFVLQLLLIVCMCLLSIIGLITSLRLKDELEECLQRLRIMVAQAQVDEFVALGRLEGRRSRYPAFRWVFPVQFSLAAVLFLALFVYRLSLGRP